MTLKAFITESNLSQEDKNLWFPVLEGLNEEQVKILEDFIGPERGREGPQRASASYGVDDKEENLRELTENFKAKRKALEDLDEKALEAIIQSEQ